MYSVSKGEYNKCRGRFWDATPNYLSSKSAPIQMLQVLTLSLSLSLSLSVARYVDAVAPYLAEHGVRTVFLATDSEEVGEM